MVSVVEQRKPKSSGGIVGTIADIKKPVSGMSMLIYGRSGTGKTTMSCTFKKPLLLIRAEDGTGSVYNVPGIKTTDILSSPDDLVELVEYQRKKKAFKTIVLDGITSYQDIVLKSVLQVTKVPTTIGFGDIDRDDWGKTAAIMKETLDQLLDLRHSGTDVVCIAQEKSFDAEDVIDQLMPTVMGHAMPSVSVWINPRVDFIGQTFCRIQTVKVTKKVGKKEMKVDKDVTQYCLRVGPHPIYMTKFRCPKGTNLPDVLVDPTYDKITKLL